MQPTLRRACAWASAAGSVLLVPVPAGAAAAAGPVPGLAWGIPFVGVLLSIALLPMLAERLWHRRMGTVAAAWVLALLLPQAVMQGAGSAAAAAWHAILIEYLPFVTLLLALYTAAGGILVRGGPLGAPLGNTALLGIGAALAGVMGTTGAAMVLIHPLLRANAHRARKVHLVVFFIVIVGNVGGASSPLGDPPLYIGFLHGVPFFWPVSRLWPQLLLATAVLLAAFYAVDRWLAASEPPAPRTGPLHLRGWPNVGLIGVVVGTVLAQGVWRPGDVVLFGQAIGIERMVGMAVFASVTLISVAITARAVRQRNMYSWGPIEEVAKLFAAIFITIGPVLGMLQAGFDGPLGGLLQLTLGSDGEKLPVAYFWLTGVLSAFLDNAPTYLVFFELAGGDAAHLTTDLTLILEAISAGAVFFGALTYIGNAPNLMVRAIASHRGVRMPGFFGYMGWSCALLLPVFALLTLLFYL
ncbi:MAG: sodium:proton antiporter [Acetobacteraceae bacterium]|nr:sodium:proton antiporter [Acetobacteraceae bacterium]